jgi:4'-phosphopantetheinyl transferase EntD
MGKRPAPRTAAEYADTAAHYLGLARQHMDGIGVGAEPRQAEVDAAVVQAAVATAEGHRRMAEHLTIEAYRRQHMEGR